MGSKDVWNLMYALGNTNRVMGDSENPQRRSKALEGAATITKNGWRCWVEHKDTGKRIFENEAELAHGQGEGRVRTGLRARGVVVTTQLVRDIAEREGI